MMGIESVSAGQYIVTLEFINNFKGNCGKENYCFKQRVTSNCMQPEVDLQGSKNNGHGILTFNGAEWLKKWRYATEAEKEEYDRLGKPYDVTTLSSNTKPKLSRFTPGTYVVSLIDGAKGISIFDKGMVAEVTGYGKIRLNDHIWSCSDEDGIKWFATSEEATKFSNELLGVKSKEQKFDNNKWYRVEGTFSGKYYVKGKIDDSFLDSFNEHIYNESYCEYRINLGSIGTFNYEEVNLAEVMDYLPYNHPDKLLKTKEESEYFYIKYDESISEVQFNQLCEVLTKKYGKFTPHCCWKMDFEIFKIQKFIRTKHQSWSHDVNWCIDNNEQGIKKQKSIYDFIGKTSYESYVTNESSPPPKTTYNPHTFEPMETPKSKVEEYVLPPMKVGNWYELVSTNTNQRWIFKLKEKTSTSVKIFLGATPHDNYKTVGGDRGFNLSQIKNVKPLTDLSEVYRLFPEEKIDGKASDFVGGGEDWLNFKDCITISVNNNNYNYSVDPIKSLPLPKTLKHQSPYILKEKTKKSNKFIRITR